MEHIFDEKLAIRTGGIREWRGYSKYNRCESTPYDALEKLFQHYRLREDDRLVDFGLGRGRVAFYIHKKFNVPVTGVELHELTLEEAKENKQRYREKVAYNLDAPLKFEYGFAENHDIHPEDNKFYFFNPFHVDIFKKVIKNIIKSADEEDKTVDIILYYPVDEYKRFLREETSFKKINKVRVNKNRYEKFLIYRYTPEKEQVNKGLKLIPKKS